MSEHDVVERGLGVVRVIRPGLLTTVQDLGRWGHQATGVPVAGPMDSFSHRTANLLVGNQPNDATLEITLIGPALEFSIATSIAVVGAAFDLTVDRQSIPIGRSVEVNAGAQLMFGRRRLGTRAYLAVSGGIQTALVLGSRATHVVSAMGGWHGRALVAGDTLPIPTSAPARRGRGAVQPSFLGDSGRARLRFLWGPQSTWFAPEALERLTSASFRVSPRSNRMGYRLEGPPLPRAREDEPISEPLAFGALQVPAGGQPILLMADRQTAGGYPKIASVIAADLPVAGQLAPGDVIDFTPCTRQEAVAALIARERALLRLADAPVMKGDEGP